MTIQKMKNAIKKANYVFIITQITTHDSATICISKSQAASLVHNHGSAESTDIIELGHGDILITLKD